MKTKHVVVNLILASLLAPLAFGHGGETGNGGTVIVDGQTYTLSDLEFKALPSQQITLSDALVAQIQADKVTLDNILLKETSAVQAFDTFFDTTVISSMNEYHFVGSLPSLCSPVSDDKGEVVGCAQGSLTFIIPKFFMLLSLDEKAELLIEIRLAADPLLQDSQVAVARAAFRAAISASAANRIASPSMIWFAAADLAAMNQFAVMFAGQYPFEIVQGGGRIGFDKGFVNFDPMSMLFDLNSGIELAGTSFHANRVEIFNSWVHTADFSGDQVLIVNSQIWIGTLHLSQANIQESNLTDHGYGDRTLPDTAVIDASQFTVSGVTMHDIQTFQGSSILLKNIGYGYGFEIQEIKGNDIQVCNTSPVPNQKIDGDHIHIGDCNASK